MMTTSSVADTTPLPAPPVTLRRHRVLPRWAPWALLAGCLGGSAGVLALSDTLGVLGLAALTAMTYAVTLHLVSRAVEGTRRAKDRLATVLVTTFFLLALLPLASVVEKVVAEGFTRLDAEFFTYSMRGVVGDGGGAYHAIVGTLVVTGITTVVSVPIGILVAIHLVEYGPGHRTARAVTFLVDVMTGIPSIVAGLFAYALGVSKWRTIVKVVLPTSAAGITTGVTLAVARVVGETAPLLVTVGATTGTNLNPFSGRMETLPIFSYYSYATPGIPLRPFLERAWTAALVLILIVVALNIFGRLVSHFFAPRAGR